jgi:regulator of protease activity HflC (stomatin/prohibitin superfamily)
MGIFAIVFGLIGLATLFSGIFTVKQQTAYIIERFGKFHSMRMPGLHFKIPYADVTAGRINLKIQQLDVIVETKTKDNVFVKLKVSVQFRVLEESMFEAFYKLQNPTEQITAYVFDTVRAEVPKMRLDDVFERKDDIAHAIRRELEEAMNEYGYGIVKALVTDIDPDQSVKNAMNHINAAERKKLAAEYEGEAERIRIVAKAKAEAESKRLQGQGIADQRREIAKGLEESVDMLNKVGINSQEASALIVVTQHYDTLQQVGQSTNSNLILLPNAPSAASDMLTHMITSFSATQKLGEMNSIGRKSQALEAPKEEIYLENTSEQAQQ